MGMADVKNVKDSFEKERTNATASFFSVFEWRQNIKHFLNGLLSIFIILLEKNERTLLINLFQSLK